MVQVGNGLYCNFQDGKLQFPTLRLSRPTTIPSDDVVLPCSHSAHELATSDQLPSSMMDIYELIRDVRPSEPPCRYCPLVQGPCRLCSRRCVRFVEGAEDGDSAFEASLRRASHAVREPLAQLMWWMPVGPCATCPKSDSVCKDCVAKKFQEADRATAEVRRLQTPEYRPAGLSPSPTVEALAFRLAAVGSSPASNESVISGATDADQPGVIAEGSIADDVIAP